MRFYFTTETSPDLGDPGLEFSDLDEALRDAGRSALHSVRENFPDGGAETLRIFTDNKEVASVTVIMTFKKS